MEKTKTFSLPPLSELRALTEEQIKPVFFQLEQHRAKMLLAAADEYTQRINDIEKDYALCFRVLADVREEISS